MKKIWFPSAKVFVAALLLSAAAAAQTLARPGWVGSGMTSQTWWQSAVIYRVQPQLFQDSDGNGVGDLRGLAQRLDYLQSIGVDAVLIESHTSDAGFDDLLSDASRHHVRVLIELGADTSQAPSANQLIADARAWLRRGVGGVYVSEALLNAVAGHSNFQEAQFLLQELRTIADSFPGERIVIAGNSPAVSAAATSPRTGPEIVDGTVSPAIWDAASLRTKLVLADSPEAGEPLLQIAPHAEQQRDRDKILAALLLSSRGAVGLTYGEEIGLANSTTAVMQWTPTNLTRPEVAQKPMPKEEVYGTYHPYVPRAPSAMIGTKPHMPSVELNTESAPPRVDPDTLPGFSTKALTTSDNLADRMYNVAVEDQNPDSLLNFYRRVLELHSSNATLRTGSVSFFNHDAEGALVWMRRAPAGARTVASVVVACNLTDHPIELSLDDDLAHLHIAGGTIRPLLTSLHVDHIAQSTRYLRLSPHSVYVGELYHR